MDSRPVIAIAPGKKNSFWRYLDKDKHLYIMLLPGIVFFAVFAYAPMYGVLIAFKDYGVFRGFAASPWVGLKHFRNFIQDPFFFRIIKNTFLLSFYSLLFGFPAPIILALMLNEVRNLNFKKVVQTVSYLPYFISTVVLMGLIRNMSAETGIFNIISKALTGTTVNFMIRSEWFRTIFIGSGIWQGVGWGSIIYLAALASVDVELYEAATIDGANKLQKTMYISIPAMVPVIVISLILSCAGLLSVGFEKAYLLQTEATYSVSDVIATYVYRRGILDSQYGYSTAVGLFNSIVSLFLLLSVNFVASKLNETTFL
jgi:putative aldouronate transport system permease protein